MKKGFNIALAPTTQAANIIALSRQFSSIADTYQLGEKSLPHITLCQFMASDEEGRRVWQYARQAFEKNVRLTFKKFSATVGTKAFWISLLPTYDDELHILHRLIVSHVKNPHNKSRGEYEPHLTLVNTQDKQFEKFMHKIEKRFEPFADDFELVLGRADEVWQMVEIILNSTDDNM